ncbi:MAG: ammonia-dependent NAD(+) synthetase [Candidatus Pristimantibacillus lignocellulolyticus]|uniref:NH(3)-dependent NAD(+) synthetase n=1 Tax=Candidatus Pristimantibacillus lignocellulolyticus TaxID=2994561 RepID=A0A9J6ZCA8_9BACL|nr:MAG: ammonia-dependent NAD(+) synthetase [Candidatus Pristimantibacillus lignocellulolyticus]
MKTKEEIVAELNVRPTIDIQTEIHKRVNFLVEYSVKTNTNGFVLGISGGADSTLAGKLAQLAVDQMNEHGYNKKFIAVRLPYGEQKDEEDAQRALAFIKPTENVTFNIASGVNALTQTYGQSMGTAISDFHKGNIKARARMIAQYAIAGENNMLVIGSDHAAEAVTGFYTKFGDGGADILPLSGLVKSQVRMLLQSLGAEKILHEKPATADLLDVKQQQLDEDELGISYDSIDQFLTNPQISGTNDQQIRERYSITQHKRELPVTIFDTWWK